MVYLLRGLVTRIRLWRVLDKSICGSIPLRSSVKSGSRFDPCQINSGFTMRLYRSHFVENGVASGRDSSS